MRRLVSVLVLSIMVLLPGCSGDPGSDRTITYWASNQGTSLADDQEVLTPVLAQFTAETGIPVDLEVISWNDLQTRIQTAITSGQVPDVVNIGNTWGVSLQATEGLTPFGPEEMEAIGGADRFVDAALATGGSPGTEPTSVPLYGLAYGLYYNKSMFSRAGLQPPRTWEQMVSAAKRLTRPDDGVWGMALAGGSYTENNHFAFITSAQNGASLFAVDGTPTFTADGTVSGVKRYLDLMQTENVVNPSNSQYSNAVQSVADFASGRAAMIINQNNANATIEANGMDPDAYGVVPFPAPSDAASDVASHTAGINIAVPIDTEHKADALRLVRWLTSRDVQADLGRPFAALPVLQDGRATFTDDADQRKTFLDVYANRSQPLPLVPTEDQFETTVGQAMNSMFATMATGGQVSTDDVRQQLQVAQNAIRR